MNQQKRVAVVTGGSSGIGLAAAHLFRREGMEVVLFARSASALAAARESVGGDTLTIEGDVTRLEDLDRLVAAIGQAHGRIDALFVNAGAAEFALATEASPEHFDRLFAVNVRGAFFTVQKTLPLLGPGSSVVFTTSVANVMAVPRTGIYAATKAAVQALVRTLAAELAPRGIRVNAVSPGPTESAIHAKYARTMTPEDLQAMAAVTAPRLALGRMARADEVAEAVIFLASPRASFVLGQELAVDGGLSLL